MTIRRRPWHERPGRFSRAAKITRVTARLETILADVRVAVEDWPKMRAAAVDILDGLRAHPPQLPLEDVKEAEAFLEWVNDDHFTFLGYREYDHVGTGKNQKLKAAPGALGVLRDGERSIFERWTDNEPLPRDIRAFMRQPQLLMLTKANQADVVFMKTLLEAGKVTPVIDRHYPLSEVPEALRYLEEGHARGKVIITI